MITIQIDGKTYKTMNESIEKTIRSYVGPGCLEEVKENKQSLTLPEMEYKGEREYYRNGIKLKILKESPSYDEMVSMGMPTELTGCQGVITEHNIGSMGYHQDVENTILRNQEDWKREHGFLPEEVRPEHPKGYLYPETINSYYDTNKTKEWNYQEYQKQLKKAQDEWWAGIKENKEPDTSILEKLRNELEKIYKDTIGKKHEENSPEHYKAYGQYLMYQRLDSFLRSLETHQFTPGKEDFSELPKINDTNLLEEAGEPIEDKIELLPEFIAYPHKESGHIYDIDRNAEQIELLTNAINKLINR